MVGLARVPHPSRPLLARGSETKSTGFTLRAPGRVLLWQANLGSPLATDHWPLATARYALTCANIECTTFSVCCDERISFSFSLKSSSFIMETFWLVCRSVRG